GLVVSRLADRVVVRGGAGAVAGAGGEDRGGDVLADGDAPVLGVAVGDAGEGVGQGAIEHRLLARVELCEGVGGRRGDGGVEGGALGVGGGGEVGRVLAVDGVDGVEDGGMNDGQGAGVAGGAALVGGVAEGVVVLDGVEGDGVPAENGVARQQAA